LFLVSVLWEWLIGISCGDTREPFDLKQQASTVHMNELTFLGSNINLVKAHNLRAMLLSLLHEGSVSRVELAEKTSLSTTTVTNLISELLEQGIVIEEGLEEFTGRRRVGRPRTALHLAADARYAVGVHIGIGLFRISVTDLFAEIICSNIVHFELSTPAEQVLAQMAEWIDKTIDDNQIDRTRIIGVGIGASGLVNYQTGVNILAPSLQWRDVPIRDILSSKLDFPVVVDNNVRAMALAEAFFGAGRGVNSLAFVYGRVGVGAGFVVGGQIFRGSSAGAGEIGHTIIIPEGGQICRCGKRGCLETLVSETSLISNAEEIAAQQPGGLLSQHLHHEDGSRPIERIFAAARAGDLDTCQMIEQRACYLGMALANLVNVINPELIFLGGMFAQGEDLFLPVAEKTMRELSFAGLGEKVSVQPTSFGWRAGVVGAAALALSTFFYQQSEGI
jgi:glucokinase-like ROK family protein